MKRRLIERAKQRITFPKVFTARENPDHRFQHNDLEFAPQDMKKFMELRGGSWVIFLQANSPNKDFCDGKYITLNIE